MALITPQLLSTAAFDATQDHAFVFIVTGGDQVVASRLIVKNNVTLEEVYNQQIQSFNFEHILPANTLTNGSYYQATITTYNAAGQASTPSSPIQFYCYTTPTMVFSNLPSGNVIANSSFAFEVTYAQAEGELLNSYSYTLYDAQGSQLATSGVQYVGSTEQPPTVLTYTFSGLSDGLSYYVYADGQTVNGTEVTTGRTLISVRYDNPDLSAVIELTDNCQGGYVTVRSNFVEVIGKSEPDPPPFVKDNTAVDLRQGGYYTIFNEGYTIGGDFTASAWGYDFDTNVEIIGFNDEYGNRVSCRLMVDYEDNAKVYVDCTVTSANGTKYYIYTPSIPAPNENDKVQIWVRRISGLYDVQLHNLGQ